MLSDRFRISLNLKKPKKKAGGRRKKVVAPQLIPQIREEGDADENEDGEADDYDDGEAEREAREAVSRPLFPSAESQYVPPLPS
jgi:hypothetical protein